VSYDYPIYKINITSITPVNAILDFYKNLNYLQFNGEGKIIINSNYG